MEYREVCTWTWQTVLSVTSTTTAMKTPLGVEVDSVLTSSRRRSMDLFDICGLMEASIDVDLQKYRTTTGSVPPQRLQPQAGVAAAAVAGSALRSTGGWESLAFTEATPSRPATPLLSARREVGDLRAAMCLEVYFDLSASPCRSVLLLLKKCDVHFTAHVVHLEKGENQAEEFRKVNPLKLVPVIVDDGFHLTESVAISKYLACRHNLADHWYPADLQRRARVDEYLAWQHTSIRSPCSVLLVLEGVLPGLTGQPVQEEKIAQTLKSLELCLEHLEGYYLQDHDFLCGDQISIADLFAYSDLMQPMGAKHDVLKDRKKLVAWRERVETFLGKDVLEEVNGKILNGSHSALQDMTPAEKEGLAQYLLAKLQMTA